MKKFLIFLLICSCSMMESTNKNQVKEFARGEVILVNQLLTKIYDQEMAPIKCVPDLDEASLFLRTITPRMEAAQDDLQAMLDHESEIKALIDTCHQDCTCSFIDDLFRENTITLSKVQRKNLEKLKKQKDLNSCLNYAKETFCESELYKELTKEKADFSYDEDSL